jgi:hypothetical protein
MFTFKKRHLTKYDTANMSRLAQLITGFFLEISLRNPNGAEFANYGLGSFSCTTSNQGDTIMPPPDKSKYSKKQKRQAEHIEERYEARGYSEKEAERRAWATVNKLHSMDEESDGSGPIEKEGNEAMQREGRRSDVHRDPQNRDEIEPE